jgi:phosphopantothenoylcysteine decarboxylase/phosphopantothenate--cysteine ligase
MRVLVGITGGIAAYKSAEIVRAFSELGHDVRVIATPNALRFIGAATLEALSHNQLFSDLYSDIPDVRHIELAQWAEVVLVAPATASFLARSASGLADDLLGNVLLATTAPIAVAPAMHSEMWLNAATESNVSTLRARGITVIDPGTGRLTGEDTGVGRLPETNQLVQAALSLVTPKDLSGKSILVVAGGTREFIDPVRYIGNRSSGKQGIALVEEAVARGASVTLIAANFNYQSSQVKVIDVVDTDGLLAAMSLLYLNFDFIVMPAAVSDYRAKSFSEKKIKRSSSSYSLELTANPDVIATLSAEARKVNPEVRVVGFAAETESGSALLSLAKEKLSKKHLHLIVANDVSDGAAFDVDENSVHIISENTSKLVSGSKRLIAAEIYTVLLDSIALS